MPAPPSAAISRVICAASSRRSAAGGGDASVKRLVTRLKWNCQCHQYEVADKVRALAREILILNDWDAVIAFVHDPTLPPDQQRCRSAPCAMPSSPAGSASGTRTDEGSRCYAAALSVIETCRKRELDVATVFPNLFATACQGLPHSPIPVAQPAVRWGVNGYLAGARYLLR